jgi:hypothetical protein
MCGKCAELDEKIERCQRLLSSISDQLTVDRMKVLVEELHTQKGALHSAEDE